MITREQFFGTKPHTAAQAAAVDVLLLRVEAISLEYYVETGRVPDIDPDTGTEISGSKNGSGDGGFRLTTATTGRAGSAHKVLPADKPEGAAVDKSDQANLFDKWLDQYETGNGHNIMLAKHGLYREHPSATQTWSHLTDKAPGSGRRTYYP